MRFFPRVLFSLTLCVSFSSCGIQPTDEIAVIGDSVTWGYGGLPGGWVRRLEEESGYHISNLGIPGEHSDEGAKRAKAAFLTVPAASVIIILHGGNDWVANFRHEPCSGKCEPEAVADKYAEVTHNQARIRDHAHELGKRTVFATYWPSSAAACEKEYSAEEFALYQKHVNYMNANTVKLANSLGDPVVRLDEIPDIGTGGSHYYDCLHPNETGYNMISARWLQDVDAWKPPEASHPAKMTLFTF